MQIDLSEHMYITHFLKKVEGLVLPHTPSLEYPLALVIQAFQAIAAHIVCSKTWRSAMNKQSLKERPRAFWNSYWNWPYQIYFYF